MSLMSITFDNFFLIWWIGLFRKTENYFLFCAASFQKKKIHLQLMNTKANEVQYAEYKEHV
jgi:hypothetical protein